jgi:hypothetical protein
MHLAYQIPLDLREAVVRVLINKSTNSPTNAASRSFISLATTLTARLHGTRRDGSGSGCTGCRRVLSWNRVIVTTAVGDVGQRLRTGDFLPADGWVICVPEPIESPVTTTLQGWRQCVAILAVSDAAEVSAEDICAVLLCAALAGSFASTRYGQVELVASEIVAGVGDLHDHLLSIDRAGGKSEPKHRISIILDICLLVRTYE